MIYEPNVGGFAMVADSLFGVLRFRDYTRVERVTQSGQLTDIWPESSVEIIGRSGVPKRSFSVVGRARSIASDGGVHIAVITEELNGNRPVLMATLPTR